MPKPETEFVTKLMELFEGSKNIEKILDGTCRRLFRELFAMSLNPLECPGWNETQYNAITTDYSMRLSLMVQHGQITMEDAIGVN